MWTEQALSSITTAYCTTGSPWGRTSTRLRELKEFRLRIIGFSQQILKEKLPLSQRPDIAQAKRECKRLHDEHLARTQQDYRTIPRSQQVRQRKEQQFEGIEEYDYVVGSISGWRFY